MSEYLELDENIESKWIPDRTMSSLQMDNLHIPTVTLKRKKKFGHDIELLYCLISPIISSKQFMSVDFLNKHGF